MPRFRIWLAAVALAWLTPAATYAQGHPIVGAYEGASIAANDTKAFDEALIMTAPISYRQQKAEGAAGWTRLEGKVTRTRYKIPAGRSSLEVMRNYEQSLAAKGFAKAFSCTDAACATDATHLDLHAIGLMIDNQNRVGSTYEHKVRYGYFTKADVHVGVLVGEFKSDVTAYVEVVEGGGMESGKVAMPTASSMKEQIDRTGKVDLYSILFDYNRDSLRPESYQTIGEISQLLKSSPSLRLRIVGHTDNTGGMDYNLDLSRRRANSVLSALIGQHGIAPDRLSSSGEGFMRPVASNETDEGRQKNRRVELIRQ